MLWKMTSSHSSVAVLSNNIVEVVRDFVIAVIAEGDGLYFINTVHKTADKKYTREW